MTPCMRGVYPSSSGVSQCNLGIWCVGASVSWVYDVWVYGVWVTGVWAYDVWVYGVCVSVMWVYGVCVSVIWVYGGYSFEP